MATFVLVSGAWLGGWVWQPVARRLREAGHDVYPVTLTGLGERAHLATPQINLDTHITDIANVLTYEDLHEVLLVGHSYGGVPVTGAADRVAARINRVVYVDSGPIADGSAYVDIMTPEMRAHTEQRVNDAGEGWRLPVFTWEELERVNGAKTDGLDDAARTWMHALAAPQPWGTYTQPLRLTRPESANLPKTAILNSFSIAEVSGLIASGHPIGQALSGPTWRFLELPTGHWPMASRPDDLADMLATIATVEAGVTL